MVCLPEGGKDSSDDSPSDSSRPENISDVLSSLSRPSMGTTGQQSMQVSC